MNRRLTIVAATIGEVEPLLDYLQANAEQHSFQTYQHHQILIDILYSGIGILETTYQLMDYTSHRHPDGWIQVGIGGAFDTSLQIGSVYRIESELLVGFGAEDQNGRILDPFKLGWSDPDKMPYTQGRLLCPYHPKTDLAVATGMTTFHAHGYQESIDRLKQGPHGQVENMEGAAFFYISLMKKIPFLSFRSISNYVEPRDKSKWQIKRAIENLNRALMESLEGAEFNLDKIFIH